MRREPRSPPALPMVRPGPRGPGRPGGRYHCRAGGGSALARSVVRALRWASQACGSPCPPGRPRARLCPSSPHPLQGHGTKRARVGSAAAYKGLGRTTPRRGRAVPLLHGRGAPRLPFPPVWAGRERGDRPKPKIAPQKKPKNKTKPRSGHHFQAGPCDSPDVSPQAGPCPRFCVFQENRRGRSDFRPLLFRTEQLFLNKSSILFTLCHLELRRGVFWFPFPW